MSYRAFAIEQLTPGPLIGLNPSIIVNKLIARGHKNHWDSVSDIEQLLSLANALIEAKPKAYFGYKMRAYALFLDKITGGKKGKDLLAEALLDCNRFPSIDENIEEIKILDLQKKIPKEDYLNYLNVNRQKLPQLAIIPYYIAHFYVQNADIKAAKEQLLNAIALSNSHNERFVQTLKKLENSSAEAKDIFEAQIFFTMEKKWL